MKAKRIKDGSIGFCDCMNPQGWEIIVQWPDGDKSSEFVSDFEIELSDGSFKDLNKAIEDGDVRIDENHIRYPKSVTTPVIEPERLIDLMSRDPNYLVIGEARGGQGFKLADIGKRKSTKLFENE